MKDKKDNQRIFHNGYLITQRDANGNALHFTYNNAAYSASGSSWKPTTANHRLTGVTRVPSGGSAQQLMTFAYDSNRCLSEIRQTVGSATPGHKAALQPVRREAVPDGHHIPRRPSKPATAI